VGGPDLPGSCADGSSERSAAVVVAALACFSSACVFPSIAVQRHLMRLVSRLPLQPASEDSEPADRSA